MNGSPAVTIGLPVYNGERYVGAALDALLGQDYTDFELIISDNASVDRTADICREFAARDQRIRYFRNEHNIGINPNFNRLLQLARAPLFRWAAHDDLVERDFLGACVELLQAAPDAVLAQSHVRIIDADGRDLGAYDGGLAGTESVDPVERFAALILSRHLVTDLYGVIRTDALRRIRGLGNYYGSDRATLAALGLLGRFVHVPRLLFMNREHPGRSSRLSDHSSERGGVAAAPMPRTWELYREYQRAVRDLVENEADRRRCFALLRRWWFVDWNAARLAVDLVGMKVPAVYDLVTRLKLRFYGPMPQIGLRNLPPAAPEASPPEPAADAGHRTPGGMAGSRH